MELSTSSSWEPYGFLSAWVSTAEHVNNILTFIPNQNKTPFPENTSVTPSLGKNGITDERCPPLTAEVFRQIEAVKEATETQVDTIFSIALVFGLPGSVLALVTLSSMAVSPTKRYMSFLMVSDFAALLLASWTAFRITSYQPFTKLERISIYVSRIFQAFSHWNLALICVERFVSVRYPFQKSRLYTRRATFLSVGAAFTVSLVPFPGSYLSGVYFDFIYSDLEVAVTILYKLIYIVIPGSLIIIFTILTACHLRRNVRHRETIGSLAEQNSRRSVTMETLLTRMMFVTVVCFAVFTFPWAFIHIFHRLLWYETYILICPLANTIFENIFFTLWAFSVLNHAVNFYVYCACAKGFRNQFARVICFTKTETRR
ncbi:hypothetical protein RRG08_041369 [Elysia crispata]|uniref:G-protein coupled receptors family 1 profile domain-containing protein n=1 Tax=Elysia crispata TaxID=231223 RepID=A0AAE1EEG8_9GAST|nr:hypothetical protein RRG08_041369 [Elysia crispata]